MPFDVATIKDKALAAKDATVSKVQRTRDRNTSVPMAKTKFAPDGYMPDVRRNPPPPPPPRARSGSYGRDRDSASGSGSARTSEDVSHRPAFSPPPPPHRTGGAPSPPVTRGTKPALSSPSSTTSLPPLPSHAHRLRTATVKQAPAQARARATDEPGQIDWAHLSLEDKQAFFEWLDEFFARFLPIEGDPPPPWKKDHDSFSHSKIQKEDFENANAMAGGNVSPSTDTPSPSARGPPPAIKIWSKPTLSRTPSETERSSHFETSYPPATTYGSQALDLACYIHPDTHWETAWYTDPGSVPPPLRNNPTMRYTATFSTSADQKRTVQFGVLFADLSLCWLSVAHRLRVSNNPAATTIVERTARYLPPPTARDYDTLVAAHEAYGEAIAAFAESFVLSGTFCARGECWDLANEALKHVAPPLPPPVPSLSRTHGHLVFAGRADGGAERQAGRWRGGDDRVRRGDIVEWRSTRIKKVGAPWGSYCLLGDPEHTAVVTAGAVPAPAHTPRDGEGLLPRDLGRLEVVEQSRGSLPAKNVYDMEAFEQGEVWIYRPIAMGTYLGVEELTHNPPAHALSL